MPGEATCAGAWGSAQFCRAGGLVLLSSDGLARQRRALPDEKTWTDCLFDKTNAKANPGKVTYASPGIGAGNHLAGELFASTLGVNVRHIPYKGSAPANTDLLAGRVTMMFQNMVSGLPLITSGRMRTRRRLASTSRLHMACC